MSAQGLPLAATDTLISPKVKPEGKGAAKRTARAVKSKAAPQQGARIWTACYIYAGVDGTASMTIRKVRACDGERAREIALKSPPGEEFVLTMVPESDEQFLGQVRLKAISAAENMA